MMLLIPSTSIVNPLDLKHPPIKMLMKGPMGRRLACPGHAVYLGNTCPWCHRVALALAFRQVPERCVARVQCLGDLGGTCYPLGLVGDGFLVG